MKRFDPINSNDAEGARVLNEVLTLYYMRELTQMQIAAQLGLSKAKVNRLIQLARRQGLVSITIRTPFQHLFDLETRLKAIFNLRDAIVIPTIPNGVTHTDFALGRAAANYLMQHLRNGMTVAIGPGAAAYATVMAVESEREYDVTIVPLVGAVQERVTTDVNYLAVTLAEKLGGKAFQLHAPAFVETQEQREALLAMRPVQKILDIARRAEIALFGVGDLDKFESRFVQFTALTPEDIDRITKIHGGVGDIAAHAINREGKLAAIEYSQRVIGLTLEEIKQIPLTIGVAATATKAVPLYGALRGDCLHALITDEAAARGIVGLFEEDFRKES